MSNIARDNLASVIKAACGGWQRPLGPIARRRLANLILKAGYRSPNDIDLLRDANNQLRHENAELRKKLLDVTGHDGQPILTSDCPGSKPGQDGRP